VTVTGVTKKRGRRGGEGGSKDIIRSSATLDGRRIKNKRPPSSPSVCSRREKRKRGRKRFRCNPDPSRVREEKVGLADF